ncbi:MAG: hypothetical protein AB7N65_31125, partial [Vicinamibacterales bacterium]
MRIIPLMASLLLLACPLSAEAQSLVLQASAGPTLVDPGFSVAAGLGVAPFSRVDLLVEIERTYLATRSSSDGRGGGSSFRGGTGILATGLARVMPLGRTRIRPYGVAGFAAGYSRPTVNAQFPDPVTNDVRALVVGGGILVPFRERVHLFAD